MAKRITEAQRKEIRELHGSGLTEAEIIERTGLSRGSVRRAIASEPAHVVPREENALPLEPPEGLDAEGLRSWLERTMRIETNAADAARAAGEHSLAARHQRTALDAAKSLSRLIGPEISPDQIILSRQEIEDAAEKFRERIRTLLAARGVQT